jgi:hypothetical protein
MITNEEQVNICKEAIVADFIFLTLKSLGETEENDE